MKTLGIAFKAALQRAAYGGIPHPTGRAARFGAGWPLWLFLAVFLLCCGPLYFISRQLAPAAAGLVLAAVLAVALAAGGIRAFFSAGALALPPPATDETPSPPPSPVVTVLAGSLVLYLESFALCLALLLAAVFTLLPLGVGISPVGAAFTALLLPFLSVASALLGAWLSAFAANRARRRRLAAFLAGALFFVILCLGLLTLAFFLPPGGGFSPAVLGARAIRGELSALLPLAAACLLPFAAAACLWACSYGSLAAHLASHKGRGAFQLKEMPATPGFEALLRKELRTLAAHPTQALRGVAGLLCLLFVAVAALLRLPAADDLLTLFAEGITPGAAAPQSYFGLFFMLLVLGFASYGSASVTLEGRSFWVSRQLPLPPTQLLEAKAAVNIILCLVLVGAGTPLLAFGLGIPGTDAIFAAVVLMLYAFASSYMGVYLNLVWPALNAPSPRLATRFGTAARAASLLHAGVVALFLLCHAAFLRLGGGLPFAAYCVFMGILMALYAYGALRLLEKSGVRRYKNLY